MSYPPTALREVLRPRAEFVTINDFSSYRRVRVQLHGKGVVLRDDIEGTDIRTKKQQLVKAGDFLVAEIDAKVGGFGIVPPELDGAIVSSHYFLFEVDEIRCLSGWLDAFIRSGQLEEQVTARGSTNYAAIRPETVLGFQIPLPDPPEQKRIVARIAGLAVKIGEAERLINDSDLSHEAVVDSALGKVFENLASRFGMRRLEPLILNAGYGTSIKCESERDEGDVPVLRIPNVAGERLNLVDLKYARAERLDTSGLSVANGDILIVRTNGSIDLVGRCAVAEDLAETFLFASYLIRLRCDHSQIAPRFLQLMLKHLRTRGTLVGLARTTAGQFNVSLGRLREAQVPVPPIGEQTEIIRFFEGLRRVSVSLQKLAQERAAAVEALLPTILAKALAGEL